MPICDYGCGQEAIIQFKNGKWCCCEKYQKGTKTTLYSPLNHQPSCKTFQIFCFECLPTYWIKADANFLQGHWGQIQKVQIGKI